MNALTDQIEIGDEAPTALYRCFAGDGSLLYVGISRNLGWRFGSHSRGSDWWSLARRKTVTLYPSRQAALDAESVAIHDEDPVRNIQRPNPAKQLREPRARRTAKCAIAAAPNSPGLLHDPVKLRQMRVRAGLTFGDVAERSGPATRTALIFLAEDPERPAVVPMRTLRRVAAALDCGVGDLLLAAS